MAKNQSEELTTSVNAQIAAETSNSGLENNDINLFENVWVKLEVIEDEEIKIQDVEDTEKTKRRSNVKRKNAKNPCKRWVPHYKHLKCDQCDYRTGYKQCMALHVLTHSDDKPHTCTECLFKTKYSVALKHHINIKHGGNEVLHKCTVCSYTTNYKWNLTLHKRKHDLTNTYKCPDCDYTTVYKHNAKKHSRKHTNNEGLSYYCDKCPFVSKYEGLMTRHLAKVHLEVTENNNKCEYCVFSSKNKWMVNKHKKNSLQNNSLYCFNCDFETKYRCALREHKQRHSEETKSILERNKKMNENKSDAKIYDESNNGIICEFKSRNEMEPEIKQYVFDPSCEVEWSNIQFCCESSNQERPFRCIDCSYTAKFKATVQRHYQRIHNQNRPYKCINCDFATKTKEQIAIHNKRSQTKKQTCKICGFTSTLRCQFAMHGKEHHPFKCGDCEYTCKKKADLVHHISVAHLGKAWMCRHCDYKATTKENFLNHEAKHTGEKPFQCELCDFSSIRKFMLKKHMNRVHNASMTMKIIDDAKVETLKKKTEKTEVFIINTTLV